MKAIVTPERRNVNIHTIYLTSNTAGTGKDTVADMIENFIRDNAQMKDQPGVRIRRIVFAAAPAAAYMSIFNEGNYKFYKEDPVKREKLINFSLACKKIDVYTWARKSYARAWKHIFDHSMSFDSGDFSPKVIEPVDLFILFTDLRYQYELDYQEEFEFRHFSTAFIPHKNINFKLKEHYINIVNDNVEPIYDREEEFPPVDITSRNFYSIKNNGTLDDLEVACYEYCRDQLELSELQRTD